MLFWVLPEVRLLLRLLVVSAGRPGEDAEYAEHRQLRVVW